MKFSSALTSTAGAGLIVSLNNVGSTAVINNVSFNPSAINITNGTLSALGTASSTANMLLNSTATFNVPTGASLTLGGTLSGVGLFGGDSPIKTGGGTLFLSHANTYAGNTYLQAGTTIIDATANSDDRLGSIFQPDAVTPAATIIGNGSATTTLRAAANITSSRTIGLGDDNAIISVDPLVTYTLNGPVGDYTDPFAPNGFAGSYTGSLNKAGTGTLVLGNTGNVWSGGNTRITAGTLQASAANVVPTTTALNISSGATFALANNSQEVGSLNGAGSITLGSATLTTGNLGAIASFTGTISGTGGGLTKTGSGTLSLTGANLTYTGLTTVNNGTLTVSGILSNGTGASVTGGTLNAGNVTIPLSVSGGAIANISSNGPITTGAITNAGNVNLLGTGTTTLTSLTGAGVTTFSNSGSLPSISGGTVSANAGLLSVTGTGISAGTVTAQTLSLPGSITGGTISTTGAATIGTLNASTGSTTVGGVATLTTLTTGTLNLNGATSSITNLNGGSITLANNDALSVASGTDAGSITGAGSLSKTGAGTLTLSGSNSYTGTTNVSGGGTLLVNGSHTGGGNYSITGATLGGSGTINVGANSITFNAGGILAPSATLASTAATTTTVTANTVSFGNNSTYSVNANGTTNDFLALTGSLDAAHTNTLAIHTTNPLTAAVYKIANFSSLASGTLGTQLFGSVTGLDTTNYFVTSVNSVSSGIDLDIQHKGNILLSASSLAANVHQPGAFVTNGSDSTTLNTSVTNTAPSGSANLNYTLSSSDAGAVFSNTPHSATAGGAADLQSTSFTSSTAGLHAITVTATDPNATGSPATTNVNLNVYRLATPGSLSSPNNIGNFRVGSTASQTLSLANNAVSTDSFSEKLTATTGLTGDATASGPATLIAAGASGNVSVGLNTSTAGAKSGTATFNFISDGTRHQRPGHHRHRQQRQPSASAAMSTATPSPASPPPASTSASSTRTTAFLPRASPSATPPPTAPSPTSSKPNSPVSPTPASTPTAQPS